MPRRGTWHERRLALALALATLLALGLLLLNAGGGPGAAAASGDVVLVGLSWEPPSLNPLVDGYDSSLLADPLTDPLIQALPDGTHSPVVAARVPTIRNGDVQLTASGMRVTLRLRPEARWSDGTPTTCRDVHHLWSTVTSRKWMIQTRRGWDLVTRVDCPSPVRAELHFSQPYADYMSLLRQPPLPAHDLAGKDFNRYWNKDMPVGNGPYRLVEWRRGSRIVIERDPAYWNRSAVGEARIRRLEFRILSDANVLNLQTSGGEIQLVERQLEGHVDQERSMFPGQQMLLAARPGFEQLGFSLRRGRATADPLVRRALAHAVDRQEIVQMLLGDPFRVQQSLLLPEHGAAHVAAWKGYEHDPAQAARLMEQAGYRLVDGRWHREGVPLQLTLSIAVDKGVRPKLAQLVQDQLASAGFDLRIRAQEGALFESETLEGGDFDIAMWNVGMESPLEIDSVLSCGEKVARFNYTGYCDRAVDTQLDVARRALEPEERERALRAAQELVAEDVPVLPLYQQIAEVVHDPSLEGVVLNPVEGVLWNVHEWTLER